MRTLIRPECLYSFLLRAMNMYYFEKLAEYRSVHKDERYPALSDIQRVIDMAQRSKVFQQAKRDRKVGFIASDEVKRLHAP